MLTPASAAPAAATLPLFLPQAPPDKVAGLLHAATLLAQLLGQGRALDSRALRSAMEAAFGGSDAGRGVGVEGRLRGARGGASPVPVQIRQRDARPGGFLRGDARHAHATGRAAAVADAPARGMPAPPAAL